MESLEQIQAVAPGMYHRYGVLDDMDDDDDEAADHIGEFNSNAAYNADMLVAGMAGLGVNDSEEEDEQQPAASAAAPAAGIEEEAAGSQGVGSIGNWSLLAHPGGFYFRPGRAGLVIRLDKPGSWSLQVTNCTAVLVGLL